MKKGVMIIFLSIIIAIFLMNFVSALEKTCDITNQSKCDRSCSQDSDCSYMNCGCYNKDLTITNIKNFPLSPCRYNNLTCQCSDNKCIEKNICGNGKCEEGEDNNNCHQDCKNKTCDLSDPIKCDKSCNQDSDCAPNNGCGSCINKEVNVTNIHNVINTCIKALLECKCLNNTCSNKKTICQIKGGICSGAKSCGINYSILEGGITKDICYGNNQSICCVKSNYSETIKDRLNVNHCGDGKCNNGNVCNGPDCEKPENEQNCPQDCKKKNECKDDSDCKIRFSSCSCANSCVPRSFNDGGVDCARACLKDEVNDSIKYCKCENTNCIGYTKLNITNPKVKILPDVASQIARDRLGELGFIITLKEVGQDKKPVYVATAEKQGKMLGIIKVNGQVSAEIDAETGEVLKTHKPWWSFMATGI